MMNFVKIAVLLALSCTAVSAQDVDPDATTISATGGELRVLDKLTGAAVATD